MLGLMQDRPLLISQIIDFAASAYPDVEIVTRTVEGPIHRYGYKDAQKRAKQVAEALQGLGVKLGDRVGTIAWNTYRHFELYFGISGIGAVLHTINPRLAPEHVAYIANHAEDKVIFVDLNLVPVVEGVFEQLKTVKHVVVMTDRAHMPTSSKIPNLLCYEELIADKPGTLKWPEFDEKTASSLCYTSGTTGNPKGVLYSHRSTMIHSMMMASGPVLALDPDTTILPVVPMFHANAWGLVYAGPFCGTKLVFPGFKLDGASIYELLDKEQVTLSAGVPTVWLAPPRLLRAEQAQDGLGQALADRRLGRALRDDRALLEGARSRSGPRLGHDRDEPARHAHALQQGRTRPAGRRALRHHRQAGPPRVRLRDEDRRRCGRRPAAGRQRLRQHGRARSVDREGLHEGRRQEPVRRRRLVPHRRRLQDRDRRLGGHHRPVQGRDQVGRRVDQLDRPRERRHGLPWRGRSGGDRRGSP